MVQERLKLLSLRNLLKINMDFKVGDTIVIPFDSTVFIGLRSDMDRPQIIYDVCNGRIETRFIDTGENNEFGDFSYYGKLCVRVNDNCKKVLPKFSFI